MVNIEGVYGLFDCWNFFVFKLKKKRNNGYMVYSLIY